MPAALAWVVPPNKQILDMSFGQAHYNQRACNENDSVSGLRQWITAEVLVFRESLKFDVKSTALVIALLLKQKFRRVLTPSLELMGTEVGLFLNSEVEILP